MAEITDINQAGYEESKPSGYFQSEAEERTVRMVKDLYEEGKKARSKFDHNWDKYKEFYDGKQWDTKRASYRSSPIANLTRAGIQTILPILTDAQPGFHPEPVDPTDFKFAKILQKAIDAWWNRRNMNYTVAEGLLDALILDYGIIKVIWDKDLEEGAGDVRCAVVDPRHIYFPGTAKDFDNECPWVIHEIEKPIGQVKRLWPDKADLITATGTANKEATEQSYGFKENIHLVSPTDKKEKNNPPSLAGTGEDGKMVRIWEAWMDDWSIEEYEEETQQEIEDIDEQGNTVTRTETVVEKKQRYKYPQGKVIKIIPDQCILLEELPNPRDDGKKPFVKLVDMIRPREFAGDGEVKICMESQKILNKILANIMDYMNFMGNPVWILDIDSGVSKDQITNQCGLIIAKNRGSEVRREIPPSIPPYVFQFYETIMNLHSIDTGIHDVTQGRKPPGVEAAAAIYELQEAAHTRIRLKERNLQGSLTKLGYLVIASMMQHYDSPRMMKVTGENDGWPEYFEFHVEKTENGYQPVVKNYRFDRAREDYVPDQNYQTLNETKGLFDIKVVSGTALPFAKAKRENLAMQLFDRKVIDEEDLLSALEYPGKDEIIRKVQERKAQAEQAAAAPPAGGPPPAA